MPYSFHNQDIILAFSESNVWKYRAVTALRQRLNATLYSVVASRVATHEYVTQFIGSGRAAHELFDTDKRWPHGFGEIYFSDYDIDFANHLAKFANTLAWRGTNQAKDMDVGTGGNKKTDAVFMASDQAVQDNTRAFFGAIEALNSYISRRTGWWTREQFELKMSADWHNVGDAYPAPAQPLTPAPPAPSAPGPSGTHGGHRGLSSPHPSVGEF